MEKPNNISISFNENGDLLQVMDLDELYDTCEETRLKAGRLLSQVLEASKAADAFMGANKDKASAIRKINQRFDGNPHCITDIVRGKIIVDTSEQLDAVMAVFRDTDSGPLKKANIKVELEKNNFEEPKPYTGYRGLSYKLSVPTGNADKPHVIELQIVSTAMEAKSGMTHKHKRAAEDIYRNATEDYDAGTRKDPALTDEELALAQHHYAVCDYHNSKIAHEEGYDRFLKDPDRHAFTPEKETELVAHMAKIGVEP
ncbi:MAG: hypothetical protein COB14_02390 [Alphaproteobacteria bacterium]|nr:MAG: hypothetical protein COB14_02390 [Alphaproteobacteria bacterium]